MIKDFKMQIMSVIPILLLIIGRSLPQMTEPPVILDDSISTYSRYCPGTKFCTVSTVGESVNATSCCQKCSCSPRCHEVGSCCPDMPNIDNKEPVYPCLDVSEFGSQGNYSVKHSKKVGLSFHVVNDCPSAEIDRKYPQCFIPVDLQDYVFVSDLNDERVYRNRHCALCNGVTEFVQWKLAVRFCPHVGFREFSSIQEAKEYMLENCFIYPIPPNSQTGMLSYCVSKMNGVHTCRSPENFKGSYVDNVTLHGRCQKTRTNLNTLFFHKTPVNYITYANIFCFLCDGNVISKASDDCRDLGVYFTSKVSKLSFLAVLSFSEEVHENSSGPCKANAVLDPYKGDCKPIYCSMGMIPEEGRCIQIANYVWGVVLELQFVVIMPTEYEQHGLPYRMMRDVDNRMKELLSVGGCQICQSDFIFQNQNASGPYFYFTSSISSVGDCTSHAIINKAKHFVSNGPLVIKMQSTGNKVVRFSFSLLSDSSFSRSTIDTENIYPLSRRLCENGTPLSSQMLLKCPHIKLHTEELNELGLTKAVQDVMTKEMVMAHAGNSSVFLCVHNYYSFLGSNAGGQLFRSVSGYTLPLLIMCSFSLWIY